VASEICRDNYSAEKMTTNLQFSTIFSNHTVARQNTSGQVCVCQKESIKNNHSRPTMKHYSSDTKNSYGNSFKHIFQANPENR